MNKHILVVDDLGANRDMRLHRRQQQGDRIDAVADIENLVRRIEPGAEDCLPEPFSPVPLRARMRRRFSDRDPPAAVSAKSA